MSDWLGFSATGSSSSSSSGESEGGRSGGPSGGRGGSSSGGNKGGMEDGGRGGPSSTVSPSSSVGGASALRLVEDRVGGRTFLLGRSRVAWTSLGGEPSGGSSSTTRGRLVGGAGTGLLDDFGAPYIVLDELSIFCRALNFSDLVRGASSSERNSVSPGGPLLGKGGGVSASSAIFETRGCD